MNEFLHSPFTIGACLLLLFAWVMMLCAIFWPQSCPNGTIIMTHVFEVFRDGRGRWRARRSDGLVDGLFVDQRSAVRFARRGNPSGPLVLRG